MKLLVTVVVLRLQFHRTTLRIRVYSANFARLLCAYQVRSRSLSVSGRLLCRVTQPITSFVALYCCQESSFYVYLLCFYSIKFSLANEVAVPT